MATQPPQKPDTIDPSTPAEAPPATTPAETPPRQPDETPAVTPDTIQPGEQPAEVPPADRELTVSARAPTPDPAVTPLRSEQMAKDPGFPDDGPLVDAPEAEIDIERKAAGVAPQAAPAVPPEAELPPD